MIYQFLFLIATLLASANAKMVYTGTLIRHGARYPIRGDIYDGNASAQNFGKLTSVGMRQQFLLGGYMKADYIDKQGLINSTLYPKQVQVFSDGTERCQQSTISFLLGLFPFGTGATIPQNLDPSMLEPPFESFLEENLRRQKDPLKVGNFALKYGFQPVPYREGSAFFPHCPNEQKIIQQRIKGAAVKIAEFQAVHAAFTQKMRIIFNLSSTFANIAGLAELFDVVTCDMFLGRELPTNFTADDYRQLTYIHDYLFAIIYGGEASQVFSTSILAGVLGNMDNFVNGKPQDIRFSLYSGHDTNVMPVLMFLNLTTPECLTKKWKNDTISGNCADAPPFASNIVFELHQNQSQEPSSSVYSVKVRYNGEYYNLCGTTSKECEYTKFSEIVRSKMVDVKKQCGITSGPQIQIIEE